MARQPAKRRRVAPTQDLDVEGDEDWQSDEISSLPASDDDDLSSASGSGSDSDSGSASGSDDERNEDDDDEDDVIDMLKDPKPRSAKGKAKANDTVKPDVEVVIPIVNGDAPNEPLKRKRGRPRKEPKEPEVKVPKKRGRPRKYAPGEKRPRRSRRKLNPDGSFKKRGRPKKVVDPDAVMMKVPKRRGRPPKQLAEGEEAKPRRKGTASGTSTRKVKREFDLLAGLDLDLEDDSAGIIPGVGRNDDDAWEDETESPRTQDDILAKLRRRILYRQKDAELQDFIDSLGPDGEPIPASARTKEAAPPTADEAQDSVLLNEGERPGLPLLKTFVAPSVPSSEKRKERQPFEPGAPADTPTDGAMSALADAAASVAAETEEQQPRQPKPKGRPPGSKNRRPDFENNPLINAARSSTTRSAMATPDHGSSLSLYPSASTSTAAAGGSTSSLVKPTSSDAYFLFNTSKRARGLAGMGIGTSGTLISSKLRALDARRLEGVVEAQTREGSLADIASRMYRHLLPVYFAQLLAGYAIIFHGVGSKTQLLTELVKRRIEAEGDAMGVVAQGAIKGFKVEDLLAEIESALSLGPLTLATQAAEGDEGVVVVSTLTAARAERIVRRFNGTAAGGPSRLFLILETFDAPGMQSIRFKSVLEILARSSHIHIMATTEHINSGFVASSAQQAAAGDRTDEDRTARLRWIWQNMSTFIPSLDEMLMMRSNPAFATWMPVLPPALDLIGSSAAFAAATSATGTGAQEATGTAYFNGLQVSEAFRTVSETSAISILKSVTTKARALFNLLAKQCLSSAAGGSEVQGVGGVAYAELLNKAKRSFLASNEADFKSLLIEFKDHHLCHINKQGTISIGLADAGVLQQVLDKLKSI